MVFEEIERLQREYTDKYVVVDATRPELARFADYTGIVKTVNYNGRALVEFLDFNSNIAWFDIGLDYIKIVPKPDPNVKKAEKAAAKTNTPAESKAPTKEEKAFKPAGAKASTADILAAARAKGGSAPAAAKPDAKPAPAKAAAPAAKPAGGKMSTADILAKLRQAGPAGGAAAAPAESAAPEAEEAPAAAPAKAAAPKKAAAEKPSGPLPTTTADKIAYCRRVDAKG